MSTDRARSDTSTTAGRPARRPSSAASRRPVADSRPGSQPVETPASLSVVVEWVSYVIATAMPSWFPGPVGIPPGMVAKEELPATLKRSPKKAQETYSATHDSAVETYGEGERAHRTAFASLKHSFEKVGDHWEPKDSKGPSDAQAAKQAPQSRRGAGETAGGVDANASKAHLMELARRLDVSGRSKMTKDELVEAIDKANRRESARSLRKGD